MNHLPAEGRYRDGRDEMNLADFPISALPRAQKIDEAGHKQDRIEFVASRYDAASRSRVEQRVTLTSTASDGLPTPADEHVILALLHVAKHSNDFEESTVHFAPSQLFDIMGWAPNGRSYTRLRDVLRRLKALTIRYQNAWWDIIGRAYEEEVATGIISAYRIARQVSGPRTPGQALLSWVTWTQSFHESLKAGNLKRLNLEVFFKLKTPTAQRMYRFLDKRFYNSASVTMDLVEFACGHVGLTDAGNVAILKRRLAPAIEELEQIGFIQAAPVSERYQKLGVGQWRVVFHAGGKKSVPVVVEPRGSEPVLPPPPPSPAPSAPVVAAPVAGPELDLARGFYQQWNPAHPAEPGARDLEQAGLLLRERTQEEARAVLNCLVQVTRKEWPECRSLSGAIQKYLGDALRLREAETRRAAARLEADRQREQVREESAGRQTQGQQLRHLWEALPVEQRQAIEQQVRERLGGNAPAAFVGRLCLEEIGRRLGMS